jgi:hypothetical protein
MRADSIRPLLLADGELNENQHVRNDRVKHLEVMGEQIKLIRLFFIVCKLGHDAARLA